MGIYTSTDWPENRALKLIYIRCLKQEIQSPCGNVKNNFVLLNKLLGHQDFWMATIN